GQTQGEHAYSVAQHAVLVTDILMRRNPGLPDEWQLAALLHDAPEYVVGDLISPFKAAIGDGYRSIEKRLLAAVHLHFGLPAELPQTLTDDIKCADGVAAYVEAISVAGFTREEANAIFGKPAETESIEHDLAECGLLTAWPTAQAQDTFLARCTRLMLT
ncbi:MAG: YfbR-like 5'-deoxynucleotidase, partial [Pseudomonadota bacterium]